MTVDQSTTVRGLLQTDVDSTRWAIWPRWAR